MDTVVTIECALEQIYKETKYTPKREYIVKNPKKPHFEALHEALEREPTKAERNIFESVFIEEAGKENSNREMFM